MNLLHIITGLSTGGAETFLYRLLSTLNVRGWHSTVVSLTGDGPVGKNIAELGVRVIALPFTRGIPNPLIMLKLLQIVHTLRPSIVHTWMYHSNLLGGTAAYINSIPVVWSIRRSTLSVNDSKFLTRKIASLGATLSHRIPSKILFNSLKSMQVHKELGYASEKMQLIPNGIDLQIFKPERSAYEAFRTELGLDSTHSLVGMVGRFDPAKDHETFIAAASLVKQQRSNTSFIMCGDDVSLNNTQLKAWLSRYQILDCVHLLGRRHDVPAIMAALDVYCSSSHTESFQNTIAEAMACGTPCVVTDVGDSKMIVGNCGVVVEPRNPVSLAEGIILLLNLNLNERKEIAYLSRSRMEQNYSIEKIVPHYERCYFSLCVNARPNPNKY